VVILSNPFTRLNEAGSATVSDMSAAPAAAPKIDFKKLRRESFID